MSDKERCKSLFVMSTCKCRNWVCENLQTGRCFSKAVYPNVDNNLRPPGCWCIFLFFSHTNHIWQVFFSLSKFCHFFTLSFELTAAVFRSIFSAILLLAWIYSDITWNHLSQATMWLHILIESAIKKQTMTFLKLSLKGQFSPSKTIKPAVDVA